MFPPAQPIASYICIPIANTSKDNLIVLASTNLAKSIDFKSIHEKRRWNDHYNMKIANFNAVHDAISCKKFSKMGNVEVPCAPSKLH
jgi:hypothetical protein